MVGIKGKSGNKNFGIIRNTGRTRFKKGLVPWNKGINPWKDREHPRGMLGKENRWGNHTLEAKKKISITQRGIDIKDWNGFIEVFKYSRKFYNKRNFILKRDNFTCQECNKNNKTFAIHHIDYDKNNNSLNNLITLCVSCHSKTNFNRNDWKPYFNILIKLKEDKKYEHK